MPPVGLAGAVEHICASHLNMANVVTCSECCQDFRTRQGLDRHINISHLKEKPYACPVEGCDYQSASIWSMRRHVRIGPWWQGRPKTRSAWNSGHLDRFTRAEARELMERNWRLFGERTRDYRHVVSQKF